jgi:glycosyltransferase involved in cell wall biosynthesis
MKTKIVLLTPLYNDWKNLGTLLSKINKIFKKHVKVKFDLIIVNDCSNESYDFRKYKLKMIKQ